MTPLNGRKILLIDQDAGSRHRLRSALEARGSVVAEAALGELGVELAKRFAPDLIVADWQLPDGAEAAIIQELKQEVVTSRIPLVVLSAQRPQAFDVPGQMIAAFFSKPFAEAHVADGLERLLAPPLRQARVLIADRSERATAKLAEALRQFGYDVVTANPGADLQPLLESQRPNAAVLHLKWLAGARPLASNPSAAALPVACLLEAFADGSAAERARAGGAQVVLRKPVSAAALRYHVEGLLQGTPTSHAA